MKREEVLIEKGLRGNRELWKGIGKERKVDGVNEMNEKYAF